MKRIYKLMSILLVAVMVIGMLPLKADALHNITTTTDWIREFCVKTGKTDDIGNEEFYDTEVKHTYYIDDENWFVYGIAPDGAIGCGGISLDATMAWVEKHPGKNYEDFEQWRLDNYKVWPTLYREECREYVARFEASKHEAELEAV